MWAFEFPRFAQSCLDRRTPLLPFVMFQDDKPHVGDVDWIFCQVRTSH